MENILRLNKLSSAVPAVQKVEIIVTRIIVRIFVSIFSACSNNNSINDDAWLIFFATTRRENGDGIMRIARINLIYCERIKIFRAYDFVVFTS